MHRKAGTALSVLAFVLAFAGNASAAQAFQAGGSVEQVYATGLTPGVEVSLLGPGDDVLQTRTANDLGGALFREVAPGAGYRVSPAGEPPSDPVTVMTQDPAPPSTDVYDDQIGDIPSDGYGYMTMRDGVKLAYSVHPPTDVATIITDAIGIELPDLPLYSSDPTGLLKSPTLIEYSGYGTADPDGPESGIALLANLMGYTVVDVNMRGTGCSGGAYDYFEPLQGLDGYDIIEIVARQPWVAHGKVGMFGISFGGISQLFTAQHRPPSLAAITPLSVIDQTQTTLYPGGILNTGFAFSWALDRVRDARPAGPDSGQPWAWEQIQNGDTECAENQALHPEAVDLVEKIRDNRHYVPEVADPLSPVTFVDKIDAPTFLACQHTDEQTGGHCPTLAARMSGNDKAWFTFTNGTHVDSLQPETMNRLFKFLELYVAQKPPNPIKATLLQALSSVVFQEVFGISGMSGRFDIIDPPLGYDASLEAWEAQAPIRVLYDNGTGGPSPGLPYPGFSRDYESFPPPGTTARSWYLAPDGTLGESSPAQAAADGFTWDQEARPLTNFSGDTGTGSGGIWTEAPTYNWSQDPEGGAVAYATPPLESDTFVLGAGAVDVWVRSSEPDVDLQVTISEIRPDGKETFVQGGWVKGLARKLDEAKSTELAPVLSLREADGEPLPSDSFAKVTVPLYHQSHAYRAGSRIRVRISPPAGDQPIWAFEEAVPAGQAEIAIGYGGDMPSRLLLPVVPGEDAPPTALPPCPSLRGQPCRAYVAFENDPAPLTVGGEPEQPLDPSGSGSVLGAASCKGRQATLVGTSGDDVLRGTNGPDVIVALGGNDKIKARGGDDLVCAGRGNDTVKGAKGADRIFGQAGHDRIFGAAGKDALRGGSGKDRIYGRGNRDDIRGNRGADKLVGGGGNDILRGNKGKDKLIGQAGEDVCMGGKQRDMAKGCEVERAI